MELPRDLPPGSEFAEKLSVTAPVDPGRYRLEHDLVEEGVARFGSVTVDRTAAEYPSTWWPASPFISQT